MEKPDRSQFKSILDYEDALEEYNEFKTKEMKRKMKKGIIGGIGVVLILVILVNCISFVPTGKVGVKYRMGQMVNAGLEAGPHLKLPFIENISRVDIREQVYESDLTAYTKDTQSVESIVTKINYYINSNEVGTIVKTIGVSQVETKLISPKATAAIKNAVGKYKAEDLIAYRSELQTKIKESLIEELSSYGISISAVEIQDITFVDTFEAVVEAKVAAEQEALRVKNETVKKEEEAKQVVIAAQAEAESILAKAEAEAKANKMINDSLSKNLIEYEQIQKWDGKYPQVMGNSVNPFVSLGKGEE